MKGLMGGIMLGCGIIIAGLTGLCSVVALTSGGLGSDTLSTIGTVLMFAALPVVVGAGLIIGGRRLIRQDREER